MRGEESGRGSGRSGVWKERGPRRKGSGRWFSLNGKEKEKLIRQLERARMERCSQRSLPRRGVKKSKGIKYVLEKFFGV